MFEKLGKFEIRRVLGNGAMGEVYLGIDPSIGREVAIKTCLLYTSPSPRDRQKSRMPSSA